MSSKKMLYPYTISAKIAQFPYKLYWNNSWVFKFSVIGAIISIPFFYKMQKLSFSPQNVAKYEEIKKKDHAHHLEHLQHLR